jgi:hypothetical protein
MVNTVRSVPLSTLAFLYGVTAFATAYALWRMKPWMREAMTCWVLAVLAMFVYLLLKWPLGSGGFGGVVPVMAPTVLLLGAGWLYVARLAKRTAL